jgi:predicted phosphatase
MLGFHYGVQDLRGEKLSFYAQVEELLHVKHLSGPLNHGVQWQRVFLEDALNVLGRFEVAQLHDHLKLSLAHHPRV